MSHEDASTMRPGCLPGCTAAHATTVSGCEVTIPAGIVQSDLGEPDLIVRSYVGTEGSLRFTEVGIAVDGDEQGDLVVLSVDKARELAVLLLSAARQAEDLARTATPVETA